MSAAVYFLAAFVAALCSAAEDHPAAPAFQLKCAACHGADGQGSEAGYAQPLFGEYSISVLAGVIERTMPEDDPESVVGEEARQIAEYIYDEFYSLEARQRKGLAPIPRVELARLTVPQYRNTVADLIGRFTPPPPGATQTEEAGLRAEYYSSQGMNKANALGQQRVDPRVDFDFGKGRPADGVAQDQFAIIWEGALLANDTGFHEFRIRSENGARLYLNLDRIEERRRLRDDSAEIGQTALIDGWVSSGEMRELTARVFLLGGRRYPLRLEFFKYLEETASIQLEWRPPGGAWSVLDERNLSTAAVPRVFVVETPFPADDRSLGYERGSAVSHEWQVATSNAAIAAAAEVVDRLQLLAGIDDGSDDRARRGRRGRGRRGRGSGNRGNRARRGSVPERPVQTAADRERLTREFLTRFASVAFRRPLSAAEEQLIREVPFADEPNTEVAVRRLVLFILNSPQFLYTDLTPAGQAPSQHAVAARLSFALWDSIPDAPLREAANKGELGAREQVAAQAQRMLRDPRTRAKVRGFFQHWLEVEERDLTKDQELFPEFDEAVIADLRYSLERFIDDVVWSERSDYRQLLLADHLILNPRLHKLYLDGERSTAADTGWAAQRSQVARDASATVLSQLASGASPAEELDSTGGLPPLVRLLLSSYELPDTIPGLVALLGPAPEVIVRADSKPDFEAVNFAPDRRAGLLTHPYLLSAFSYHNNSSPIHRGVFLTRNIIGRSLKPPPFAVAFKENEFPADLTMREKITQLTRDAACMSCHKVINPLGFTLENYDAVGRWRMNDTNDRPLDTKADYTSIEGETFQLQSARDVAKYAAANESAHRAFVKHLFHYLVKQDPAAYERGTVDQLQAEFVKENFHVQHLLVKIAVLAAQQGCAEVPDSIPELDTPPE